MPDYKESVDVICKIVQPFLKREIELSTETELVGELGLTSLQVMAMIEQLEDHYDVSIPLNILPEVRTIHDLATQLENLV